MPIISEMTPAGRGPRERLSSRSCNWSSTSYNCLWVGGWAEGEARRVWRGWARQSGSKTEEEEEEGSGSCMSRQGCWDY
jgi:hypothetical protein